ncbi:MAG: helix-turn-helix domain-containing protein [Proteobacteria bacterium]|nr:helix-turn-helix domain-containing protein [Pseudomonadota bacterium]MBU1709457.1 helix-turn-helix domain-containing protein [Pseudomonadota bacterium]
MKFFDKLIEIRRTAKKSQKEMAEDLGIGYRTLQRYEEGKNIPKGLGFFLELINMGYSLDWLFTGDGEKHRFVNPEFAPILREINLWLDVISKKDEGYNDWFRIEFCKRFPEFVEWTENDGSEKINSIRRHYL